METLVVTHRGLMPEKESHINNLIPRLLVLGLFLGVANFWAQRHLEWPLLEKMEGAPLVSVLIPFLAELLGVFGGKRATKGLHAWIASRAVIVLRTSVLTMLWLVLLVGGSMISSVTVIAPKGHRAFEVAVQREGVLGTHAESIGTNSTGRPAAKTLEADEDAVRFLRWTNPFGRAFAVEVEGFRPFSFDLYPWIGKRVRVDTDLQIAPSVLVRVPLARLAQLPGSRIELWCATANDMIKLGETNTSELHASALFGKEVPVDARLLSDWEHELRLGGAEGAALSKGYLAWRHPMIVPLKVTLAPGTKLEARFVPHDPTSQISKQFVVTSETLQDVQLTASAN